jgi:beta-lactam-binding protein with PASTA domain
VPSVTGMSVRNAKAVLTSAGFMPVVDKNPVFVDYAPKGTVAYTAPGRGADAYLGQAVTIYVSGGAKPPRRPGGTSSPPPIKPCPPKCNLLP